MKSNTRKTLKYLAWSGISLIVFIGIAGFYVYSIIPKKQGHPVKLQTDLFVRPSVLHYTNRSYIYNSAVELAALIKAKKVSAYTVTMAHLAQIKNNNYKYNALIWLREKEALEDAQKADEALARGDSVGVLHGVPVTVKEFFWVKGSPCTMNSNLFGFTAPDDGPLVKQLKKEGAIILGTTNVPFMLADYQTYGEVYPAASNPYDTSRTPGGSTGGGAAALAAGFSAMELGSDMGGSIRVPAAFCGLYGLKPTYGLTNITQGGGPDTSHHPTRMALAVAGPLARTPDDLGLMWNVLKQTPLDPSFKNDHTSYKSKLKAINEYRLAWLNEWNYSGGKITSGHDVRFVLKDLMDSLAMQGSKIEQTQPDNYDQMTQSFLASFASIAMEGRPWLLRKIAGYMMKDKDDHSGNFDAMYASLNDVSDAAWKQLEAKRQILIDEWENFFKEHDFLICPITYGPAFKKCKSGEDIEGDDEKIRYMNYVGFSFIFNATGHPCIIIPMGLNKDGLPIALQVVGRYYSENDLIHFAKSIERFTPGFIIPEHHAPRPQFNDGH